MSVSSISDANLDFKTSFEEQDARSVFRAALPYSVEPLTKIVGGGFIIAIAFKANVVGLVAITSLIVFHGILAFPAIAISIMASRNSEEFNSLIGPALKKANNAFWLLVVTPLVVCAFFNKT